MLRRCRRMLLPVRRRIGSAKSPLAYLPVDRSQRSAPYSQARERRLPSNCFPVCVFAWFLLRDLETVSHNSPGRRLIGGGVCPGVCGFFPFRAGRKQFEQHTVTLLFEFCDRTAIRFLQYAVHNGLLHLGAELRDRAEIFPPCSNGAGQVLHEVLDPAFAACEMEQKTGTHQAPTQSR